MTSSTVTTPNGNRRRRPLETPSLHPREPAVRAALDDLTAARKDAVAKAQKIIDDNGLTIEVARLRERLTGLPPTDVRRELLATAGVPEKLFLDAVKDAIADVDDEVTDTTVEDLGKTIAKSFDDMSKALIVALDKIAKANDHDPKHPSVAAEADRPAAEKPDTRPATRRPGRGAS